MSRIVRHSILLITLALAGAGHNAVAAGVNDRQAQQQDRIANGVASGELTASETLRLQRQQAHIANTEARMRADDGVLGPIERARLDNKQDRANARIYRQKHDPQSR